MDYKQISDAFKKIDKNAIIGSIADAGNGYIVYLTNSGLTGDEYVTDNEYFYNNEDGSITPFRVTDDPKTYARAMRHIVYMRPELRNDI